MDDYGLSVRQLAHFAGVTERAVRRWRKRGRIPEPYLSALKHRLGVHPKNAHDAWDGWHFHRDRLISPEGEKYSQADIRSAPMYRRAVEEYRGEIARSREEADQARELRARVADVIVALKQLVQAAESLGELLPTDELAVARSMTGDINRRPKT